MPQAPKRYKPAGQVSYDRQRGNSSQRGYDAAWQRFRKRVLAERPLCEDCKAMNYVTAAREVHHLEKVRDNPARRLDETNVRCLCKPCHSKRTAKGE